MAPFMVNLDVYISVPVLPLYQYKSKGVAFLLVSNGLVAVYSVIHSPWKRTFLNNMDFDTRVSYYEGPLGLKPVKTKIMSNLTQTQERQNTCILFAMHCWEFNNYNQTFVSKFILITKNICRSITHYWAPFKYHYMRFIIKTKMLWMCIVGYPLSYKWRV